MSAAATRPSPTLTCSLPNAPMSASSCRWPECLTEQETDELLELLVEEDEEDGLGGTVTGRRTDPNWFVAWRRDHDGLVAAARLSLLLRGMARRCRDYRRSMDLLVRDIHEVAAEKAAAQAEARRYREALEDICALHIKADPADRTCVCCRERWPCTTYRVALGVSNG